MCQAYINKYKYMPNLFLNSLYQISTKSLHVGLKLSQNQLIPIVLILDDLNSFIELEENDFKNLQKINFSHEIMTSFIPFNYLVNEAKSITLSMRNSKNINYFVFTNCVTYEEIIFDSNDVFKYQTICELINYQLGKLSLAVPCCLDLMTNINSKCNIAEFLNGNNLIRNVDYRQFALEYQFFSTSAITVNVAKRSKMSRRKKIHVPNIAPVQPVTFPTQQEMPEITGNEVASLLQIDDLINYIVQDEKNGQ